MKILVCDDYDHALAVDWAILDWQKDAMGARGGNWSGVFTNGTQFGVVWDDCLGEFVGAEPGLPLNATIVDDVDGEWTLVPPPEPEAA
jgi:hypothetical protein